VKPTPVFKVEEIASGLRAPWAIAFLPDGRVFFTEREGRVRVIENGRLRAEPVLTVPDIKSWTKMGLLGLAISRTLPRIIWCSWRRTTAMTRTTFCAWFAIARKVAS
jgi:glucose/arabinose dehydrogenase